ncbi:MAG TPA: translation initiation factor IF-3 [Alphaproteobacteria bacterium]|nr:translation initiation factor IF-3 [Alphaproteobacteria bacterium]
MAKRPEPGPQRKDGPRVNDAITVREVRLIDDTGENHGVVSIDDALRRAEGVGLDLVEISPHTDPPVCKILDYGKFKYQAQKKASEARKKQKTIEVKEIKMRPGIDQHDYDVKMRAVEKFLQEGDKVKVTLRFRGREMAHKELGMDLLERVRTQTDELAKVEQLPKLEGRQMSMVIAPR